MEFSLKLRLLPRDLVNSKTRLHLPYTRARYERYERYPEAR